MGFTFSFDNSTETEIAGEVAKLKETFSPSPPPSGGVLFSFLHFQFRKKPIPGFAFAVGSLRRTVKALGKDKVKRWLNHR
jgi:hypothetical protein